MTTTVIFLHGFASSGQGSKGRFFGRNFAQLDGVNFHAIEFTPTPVDFEYMTTTGLINRLRQYVLDRGIEDFRLIGSSHGGLVGLNYAARFGGVARLLLLAPSLWYEPDITAEELEFWRAHGQGLVEHYAFNRQLPIRYDLYEDGRLYEDAPPPPAPIMIVHGRDDDVVPIGRSRDYAKQHPGQVQLIEVNDGHRLSDQLDLIWGQAKEWLIGS